MARQCISQPDSPDRDWNLGTDPFGNTLDSVLAGKKVNARSFRREAFEMGNGYQGLQHFVRQHFEAAHLDEIFHMVKGLPILTIGQMPDFARRGGIINFYSGMTKFVSK